MRDVASFASIEGKEGRRPETGKPDGRHEDAFFPIFAAVRAQTAFWAARMRKSLAGRTGVETRREPMHHVPAHHRTAPARPRPHRSAPGRPEGMETDMGGNAQWRKSRQYPTKPSESSDIGDTPTPKLRKRVGGIPWQ